MKKFTILLGALMLTVSVFAQVNDKNGEVNMMSKRGEYILPVEGDFALGINAVPIVNYFGNLFNGNVGNTASFDARGWNDIWDVTVNNPVLFGKYYLSDKSAIRAGLTIGIDNEVKRVNVTMNQEIPDPKVTVTDVWSHTGTVLGLGADYLMYRGKGRVQGFYGGGLSFVYEKTMDSYTWGNLFTTEFPDPYWCNNFNTGATTSGGERPLSKSADRNYGITLGGVVGVEYFVAPKISIGGEFRLGLYAGIQTKGIETVERWTGDADKGAGREIEVKPKDANNNSIALKNASTGSIFMMFHF